MLAAMVQPAENQIAIALSDKYQTLLEVTESIVSHRDLSQLFHHLAKPLHNVLPFDYLSVRLHDPQRNVMHIQLVEKSGPAQCLRRLTRGPLAAAHAQGR